LVPEADENEDTGTEDGSENPNIRQLREQAKAGREATAANEALQREVAFLKAGIDTDSKLGKLLFRSYEGDLTDIETLKAEATELGAIKVVEQTTEGGESGEAGGESEGSQEPTGSSERRDLASGATVTDNQEVDPNQVAHQAFESAMSRGETWETAAGEMFHSLAEAAAAGDRRVVLPQNGRRVQG
jgi:hypothetical protein